MIDFRVVIESESVGKVNKKFVGNKMSQGQCKIICPNGFLISVTMPSIDPVSIQHSYELRVFTDKET